MNHKYVCSSFTPEKNLLAIKLQIIKYVARHASSRKTNDDGDSDDEESRDDEGDEGYFMAFGLDSLPFQLFLERYEAARDRKEFPLNVECLCLYL